MDPRHLLGDIFKRDLAVGHIVDLPGVSNACLDTDAVVRVLNDVVIELDRINGIV